MDEKTEKILICMNTVLYGETRDHVLFERLEDLYLTNRSQNGTVMFAMLATLGDSEKRRSEEDGMVLSYAEACIRALSVKYGVSFFLFVCERWFSAEENCYFAMSEEERALALCRFLRGGTENLSLQASDDAALHEVKYLIFLRPEMIFDFGTAQKLAEEIRISGQDVLVPNVRLCERETWFDKILYENIHDAGCRIVDVDAFLISEDWGRSPQIAEMSEDLVFRKAPHDARTYYRERHQQITRDIRGFFALLWEENSNHSMSIAKNMFLDAMPFFFLLLLFVSGFFGEALSVIFLLAIGGALFCIHRTKILCSVVSLAWDAYLFADALIRVFFSQNRRKSEQNGAQVCLDEYILRFSPSMMIGFMFFCLHGVTGKILGVFWMLAPFVFWMLSNMKWKQKTLCAKDRRILIRYIQDSWLFFREEVNEETYGLPPDNVEAFSLKTKTRYTSPSGIGMYLLSLLSARDLDMITDTEFYERVALTAQTLLGLFKWKGHLYERYELETLAVAENALISTEESGVFLASIYVFCEGAREYGQAEPRLLGVIEMLFEMAEETVLSALYDAEKKMFYQSFDAEKGIYSKMYHDVFMSEARLVCYMAAARGEIPKEGYFAPVRHAVKRGALSQNGSAASFFLPSLFLGNTGIFFEKICSHAYREQKKESIVRSLFGKKQRLFGMSESGYFTFGDRENDASRAFGAKRLALIPNGNEAVIAPYASFLMLSEDPDAVMENLMRLETLGMYGRYGFYEALDLTPSRVGKGCAFIKRFSARHVGMSMAFAAELLTGKRAHARFMRHPVMRASRVLLWERMPSPCRMAKQAFDSAKAVPAFAPVSKNEVFSSYIYTLLHPEMAMLSNNKTKLFASSSGHIAAESGELSLFSSDFDLYSLGRGFRVYVMIDGVVLPTVPLMAETDGFSSRFSFHPYADRMEYRSHHTDGVHRYDILLRLSVLPDREQCEIVCEIEGVFSEAHVLWYSEPTLMRKQDALPVHMESVFYSQEQVLLYALRGQKERSKPIFFGISGAPLPLEHFFESEKEGLFPPIPNEYDYASLMAKASFSDYTGELFFPVCVMKSAPITSKMPRAMLTFAVCDDADDLLYMLSGKKEGIKEKDSKIRELLSLQVHAAGDFDLLLSLERFLLRSMIFGQIRPRIENSEIVDKDILSRFSLSGKNPIVYAVGFSSNEERLACFRELLGVFKYMCIRGLRYDFVILYRTKDMAILQAEVCQAGLEGFLSLSCGLFLIDADTLSGKEQIALDLIADVYFDLSRSLAEVVSEHTRAVPISVGTRMLLKQDASSLPPANIPKDRHHAYVLASQNFGTVMTPYSLGFSYVRRKVMQILTASMESGGGERLFLRIYDARCKSVFRDYDLCAVSSQTIYDLSTMRYVGEIDSLRFSVEVSLCGKATVKRLRVTVESTEPIRVAVLFSVRPSFGETDYIPRLYRFRIQKNGVYITNLLSESEKCRELFVSSPNVTVCYTEQAAMRSDGTIFRGEADAAILAVRMELYEKKTVDFYLSAVFSEKHRCALSKLSALPPSYEYAFALWDAVLYARGIFRRMETVLRVQMQTALSLHENHPERLKTALLLAAADQYDTGELAACHYGTGELLRAKNREDTLWFLYASLIYRQRASMTPFDFPIAYRSTPILAEKEYVRREKALETAYTEPLREHIERAANTIGNYEKNEMGTALFALMVLRLLEEDAQHHGDPVAVFFEKEKAILPLFEDFRRMIEGRD